MCIFIYSDPNENTLCVVNTKMMKNVLGELLQMQNMKHEPRLFAEMSRNFWNNSTDHTWKKLTTKFLTTSLPMKGGSKRKNNEIIN